MMDFAITHRRLHNHRLTGAPCATPDAVVRWCGAVQAQDYAGAKWAVGQRVDATTDAAIDQALADGTILRTHVLRPTWHFVVPDDIRWLLALTAPRVMAASVSRNRQLALDEVTFARANAAIADALVGGKHRTRLELAVILQQAGIVVDGQRLVHLLMRAELDSVICSGPLHGKQFTYALLDERAPHTKALPRDEALAALTLRYMTSHGPATARDFVWWSGLTMTDAKAGIEMVKSDLLYEIVDGRAYWFAASAPTAAVATPTTFLLPNYDEYIVGYTDRSAALVAPPAEKLDARGNVLFNHMIVIDGQVVGTWKRVLKRDVVVIDATSFASFSQAEAESIAVAAARYGRFLGLPATVRISQ